MVTFKAWCSTHSSNRRMVPFLFPPSENKRRFSSFLVFAFICLVVAGIVSAPARAAYMFASDTSDGYLKRIDQTTGEAAKFGSAPIGLDAGHEIQGLSASPDATWIYGAEVDETGWDWEYNRLWKINVTTGVGNAVGGAFEASFDIRELAYDSINYILYGTDYRNLYTVDQNTGKASFLKSFGSGIKEAWALDYDVDTKRIYGVGSDLDKLFWIDPDPSNHNEATLVGSTGRDDISDIAFDRETGLLYGIEVWTDPDYFFSIDKLTGATTNIGTGMGEPITVKGLAKPIPEPTTFLLLGSGLLGLMGLVRKKSGKV